MIKPTDRPLSDLSMLELFALEADNQTEILIEGLLYLEENPNDSDNLERLMRASHSLKGAARIVGLESIVGLSHLMEDCFVAAQRGNLTLNAIQIDVLLQAVDIILNITKVQESELENYLVNNAGRLVALEDNLKQFVSAENRPLKEEVTDKKASSAGAGDEKDAFNESMKGAPTETVPERTITKTRLATDNIVRVDAQRMTRLLGLSSELVVESRWLKPLSESFVQLKKRHAELTNILENLRESLLDSGYLSNQDNLHFSAAQKKLTECRNILTENLLDLDDYDRRNYNLSSRIYNEVIGTRMRPFVEATQGLQRTVRDLSHSLGKNVALEISGQETPVDSDVVEMIKAPLNHLVRNSVDHGVESKSEREKSGKCSEATIKISAHHGGGMLTIQVEDDGRGIDVAALREKIVERGFATPSMADKITDSELIEFLYLPDFSTRDTVTEISGRGVGLDVVRSMIGDLRGSIRIENSEGSGIKFVMQLPVTISVLTAIVSLISGEYYAFPLSRIERLEAVDIEQIKTVDEWQYVEINGRDVRIVSAAQALELDTTPVQGDQVHIVMLSKGGTVYGVVVDSFVGQRELSVQVLDKRLEKIQDISAAALMEDGAPVLIVDVDDLIRTVDVLFSGGFADNLVLQKAFPGQSNRKRILVVDDSLTVREVEKKLLVDQGYLVDVAVDGMDGWNAIRRSDYDLLITDVDMPRMDGVELVELLKKDRRLASLPVMIVSYKDRHEDRRRGLDAGADYYLSKGSFHDETLIEAVVDLIGEANE